MRLIYGSESRKLQKSMKQQNYIEGNFDTKPQKAVKKWSTLQTGQAAKFRNLRNSAGCENPQHCKISAILTLLLYLAPIDF